MREARRCSKVIELFLQLPPPCRRIVSPPMPTRWANPASGISDCVSAIQSAITNAACAARRPRSSAAPAGTRLRLASAAVRALTVTSTGSTATPARARLIARSQRIAFSDLIPGTLYRPVYQSKCASKCVSETTRRAIVAYLRRSARVSRRAGGVPGARADIRPEFVKLHAVSLRNYFIGFRGSTVGQALKELSDRALPRKHVEYQGIHRESICPTLVLTWLFVRPCATWNALGSARSDTRTNALGPTGLGRVRATTSIFPENLPADCGTVRPA